MRILFVLPAPVRIPMGGAAVVYRHAGELAARGHRVTVAAPQRGDGVRGLAMRAAVRVRDAVHGVPDRPLLGAEGVQTVEPPSWRALSAGAYDAVIATGHQTAPWVAALVGDRSAVGFYFLQHDERHLDPRAAGTWALPLVRVAVSGWVAATVRAEGWAVAGVVPNAVDPVDFAVDAPISGRSERVVALYHRLPSKGPDVLVEALDRLREQRPAVEATVVSARPPSHRLPSWVEVVVRPPQGRLREIYNGAAVCLHTSRTEGWGLVPMEAAACGCAVVATASGGPSEFLTPGRSLVEVPVGDAGALAAEAAALLEDDRRRVALAEAGIADVARFSWDRSTDALEQILLDHARR
ncbi:glycosyltransferase family 4 protein [Rubrivirga sp.]|uniref:glycosyltransferase family 4 protein n=1 Tax=Rubrivirga sp. TaxID=1885344 RepID=UPI003B52C153